MRPKLRVYRPGDEYVFAHLKRDGIWLTLSQEGSGVTATTRHPTDVTPQLLDHPTLDAFREHYRGRATLYCELYVPGHHASAVKNRMAEGRLDELRIEAFATPDLPADAALTQVMDYCTHSCGVPFAPWNYGCYPCWQDAPDAEGVVYKNGNLLDWAKEKRIATLDAVVTDVLDGNGKYAGLVGALELSVEGRKVARCSGMTDAERITMGDQDWDLLKGRVVEVAYQYVGAGGRLRHPRFVRWRDDKRVDECKLDQDPDLEEYHR